MLATVFSHFGGYATPQAFVNGLQPAVLVGSGVLAVGAVAALLVPGLRSTRSRTEARVRVAEAEEVGAAA